MISADLVRWKRKNITTKQKEGGGIMYIIFLTVVTLLNAHNFFIEGIIREKIIDPEYVSWSLLEEIYPEGGDWGVEIFKENNLHTIKIYKDEVVLRHMKVDFVSDTNVIVSGKVIYGGPRNWNGFRRFWLKRFCKGDAVAKITMDGDSIYVAYELVFDGKALSIIKKFMGSSEEKIIKRAKDKIALVVLKNAPRLRRKIKELKKQ